MIVPANAKYAPKNESQSFFSKFTPDVINPFPLNERYIHMYVPTNATSEIKNHFLFFEKKVSVSYFFEFFNQLSPHLLIRIKSFHNLFSNFTVPSNAKHFFSYDSFIDRIFFDYIPKITQNNNIIIKVILDFIRYILTPLI